MDIHDWLSNQYSLSSSAVSLPAAIRADSPLLGFPSSDVSSDDPLLYPAPNYARDHPRTDDPDRDIAIKCLIHDMNSWQVFQDNRDKPLPPPPIRLTSSEQSSLTPPSTPCTLQLFPQPTPLPPSASPTRRSSRFPSMASAVTLGLGSEHRKAVYIPSPQPDSPVDSEPEPELKLTLVPSSSPTSTSTVLTTPALSPITTPAMSPTATSFSGHDSYQDEKNFRSPSRKPSQVVLLPLGKGLSRKSSQPVLSLSRNSSLGSSHSPLLPMQPSRKPSHSHPSHSPKPSSPTPSLYLSRKSSFQFYTTASSRKSSFSCLSHQYIRGTTPTASAASQVFVGSDGDPVERGNDGDATVMEHHTRKSSTATDDLFTPPSPSISTFSQVSHSSTSPSPEIAFQSPSSSFSSNVESISGAYSPDTANNAHPPSPPLTPTTPLQTNLYPHSDPSLQYSDSLDGLDGSRSRWSLTSSLLEAGSPTPHSPHFTLPFSSSKEHGRAHAKTKSSASSPENSTFKDQSHQGKDQKEKDRDKSKGKVKGKMGRKRARLVSFISRLGGAQGGSGGASIFSVSPLLSSTQSTLSVPTTGPDTPDALISPISPMPTPPPPVLFTSMPDGDADKVTAVEGGIANDVDVAGSRPTCMPALTPLAMVFPPVDSGSVPTSPVSPSAGDPWNESVPSSPTSFSGVGMGALPSSPSVPAFPRFDDSGSTIVGAAKASGRGRANTLSSGTGVSGSRLSSGLSLAGMIGGAKRRLVVSGIEKEDVKGYEAVRSWCESFGEVRHISRKSNGDLHIDFRKSSVAETVCRVQAQVQIKGAGSVCLSWYTKK